MASTRVICFLSDIFRQPAFDKIFTQIVEALRFDSCWINLGSFMLLNLPNSNLVLGYRSMFLRNKIKGLFHCNPDHCFSIF